VSKALLRSSIPPTSENNTNQARSLDYLTYKYRRSSGCCACFTPLRVLHWYESRAFYSSMRHGDVLCHVVHKTTIVLFQATIHGVSICMTVDFVPDRSSCMLLRGMCLVVVVICHMLAWQGYALGLVHGAACDAGSFVGKERPMLLPQL
jgi:hypothetical protein